MENKDQPAFASPGTYNPNNLEHNGDHHTGLTKREEFARSAMQALVTGLSVTIQNNEQPIFIQAGSKKEQLSMSIPQLAEMSVMIADELLKQLEK